MRYLSDFAGHRIFVRICVPCALACLIAVLFSGCQKKDGIQTYTVKKPAAVALSNPPAAPTDAHPGDPVATVDRMIGAIVPRGPRTWFFKMVGPNAAVESQIEKFAEFIGTVKIDEKEDARPTWTLPKGWTEKAGDAMRFATIVVDAPERPLDLTVTVLPTGAGSPNAFILSNVNRWRGQLSLPPVDESQLFSEAQRTEETRQSTINGMTVTFVNLVGKSSGGGMGSPPFASKFSAPGLPPIGSGAPPAAGPTKAAPSKLTFKTPEGWKEGTKNQFSAAALQVVDGNKKIDITATELPKSGLLQNVNRWRTQINLEPIDEQKLAGQITKVPVGVTTGDFVEMTSSGDKQPAEAILGVIIDQDDRTWFFKLKGDAQLAQREKAQFLEFVKSVRFE